MQGDVGPLGVVASLVLVGVAVALSWRHGLGLVRSLVEASGQALVQLLVVGAALVLVIDPSRPIALSWLWVTAMVLYAAWTVKRRVPDAPGVLQSAIAAFGLTVALAMSVLLGFSVFPVEGRTIIPLAGMAVGNSMTASVVAARSLVERFEEQRGQVEAALALGMSPSEAARPIVRTVLRDALSPQIERTRTVGLISLPGAMVGLILAGVDPLDAVLVQVVVMYLVLGAVATSATTVGIMVSRQLFTPDWRPVRRDG